MDIETAIGKLQGADAYWQNRFIKLLREPKTCSVTMGVVKWALTNDRRVSDLFHDLDDRESGLAAISKFAMLAMHNETTGYFCVTRTPTGRPLIAFFGPTDPERGQVETYLTPDPGLKTAEDFIRAVEEHEAANPDAEERPVLSTRKQRFFDMSEAQDEAWQGNFRIRIMGGEHFGTVTMRAIAWAIENDHHISDVFHDFDQREPSLTCLALFANRACGEEYNNGLRFARYRRGGAPVIVLTRDDYTSHDPRSGLLVVDRKITTFEEFSEAYEAHNFLLASVQLPLSKIS